MTLGRVVVLLGILLMTIAWFLRREVFTTRTEDPPNRLLLGAGLISLFFGAGLAFEAVSTEPSAQAWAVNFQKLDQNKVRAVVFNRTAIIHPADVEALAGTLRDGEIRIRSMGSPGDGEFFPLVIVDEAGNKLELRLSRRFDAILVPVGLGSWNQHYSYSCPNLFSTLSAVLLRNRAFMLKSSAFSVYDLPPFVPERDPRELPAEVEPGPDNPGQVTLPTVQSLLD